MIGYATVGTQDLARARVFYDPIFAEMGAEICFSDENVACWGKPGDDSVPRFFVCYPYDGATASAGNGAMTAFLIGQPARIRRVYDIAIKAGGSDEGAPGPRPEYGEGFYAAYVRDPDGNKLAFVCYDAAPE